MAPECIVSKAFVPFCERPFAADDWPHIEASTAEQLDDTFPDGPVMTEAALQAHILLHQRIE
jgi:hypothetical protein